MRLRGTYDSREDGIAVLGDGERGDYFLAGESHYYWSEINRTWTLQVEAVSSATDQMSEGETLDYKEAQPSVESRPIVENASMLESSSIEERTEEKESIDIEEREIIETSAARRIIEHSDDHLFDNDVRVCGVMRTNHLVHPFGSSFLTLTELQTEYPMPRPGWWAFVGEVYPQDVYRCAVPGVWELAKANSSKYTLLTSWELYDGGKAKSTVLSAYLGKQLYDAIGSQGDMISSLGSDVDTLFVEISKLKGEIGSGGSADRDWIRENFATKQWVEDKGYATETFVNEALKGKLDKSTFDKLFRVIYNLDGSIKHIETDYTFVSLGDIQSLAYADPIEGDLGGSVVGLLTSWAEYDSTTAKDLALSAELGHGLLGRIQWLEGAGFLTAADISNLATNSALTAHINDTAAHITAAERAKWNKTATDLSAILGTDSDTIINKWEEVIAFLDTYTEADTLANLLSNKADKATTLAGYGITDAYTKTALDTLLGNKVSKSGDTMTGLLKIPNYLTVQAGNANRSAFGYSQTYGSYLYDYASDKYLGIKADGTPHFHGNKLWHSGNMGPGSNLNADLLDGLHASDLFATKTLFTKADYQHYVVLLWKTNEVATHRINGKIYTETPGSLRYQAADIDMWFSRWSSTGYDANLRLVTYGLGTAWKLVTCTYNGEEWYALQHTNIQATVARFIGVSARINFTAVKYYTSNTSTVNNAEIYNSIVDRSNLLKRSYVGGNAIAYITDTVAAADKLSNNAAFTAWGQTFFENGVPKSVSGNMTGVGTITFASAAAISIDVYGNFKHKGTATTNTWSVAANNGTIGVCVRNDGNVGIGTTSPSEKLDVAGTTRTSVLKIGSITLKDVNGHLEIDKTIVSLGDVQSLSDADVVEGGGMIADMLTKWGDYKSTMAETHALSAGLGVELHNRLTGIENSYVSKIVADELYQPKGNYALASALGGYVTVGTAQTITGAKTFSGQISQKANIKLLKALSIGTGVDAAAGSTYENYHRIDLGYHSYDRINIYEGAVNFFQNGGTAAHTTITSTALTAPKFIKSGGTSSQFLKADGSVTELTALDDRYVNVSGDTMTNYLTIDTAGKTDAPLRLNSNGTGCYLQMGASGTIHGNYGAVASGPVWNKNGINYTIWHSGNYAAVFDSRYVNASGDTMTGALTFLCGTDTKLIFDNTDGEKYTKISFRENGEEYAGIIAANGVTQFVGQRVHAPYYTAATTTLCENLNADLLDGYHADINDTANTLVVRDTDAHARISAIRSSRAISADLSGPGWYRVYTSTDSDAYGDTVLLNIRRSYANANNEAYQFSISTKYSAAAAITQLSGVYGAHYISKIRVLRKPSSHYYIDIYYSGTNNNLVCVSGFGTGTFCAPVAATIPDGYTATEFDTVQGVKSNNQIISTDSFRLPYSSISDNGAYLQLISGGNEMLVGGAEIMYVNYRAASAGTVKKWIWCAGSSSTRAAMEMGDLTAANITAASLTAASFVKFQQSGASAFVQLTATADGRVNVLTAAGSMGSINGKDGQWDFTKAYISTFLSLSDTSKIYGSPAIASGDKYWFDHGRTKGMWWDSSIKAFRMNGTLVVDGDIQSLSNGAVYDEVVRMDLGLIYGDQTVKIPATAKEVIITCHGDEDIMTLQIDGNTSDVDVIIIKVLDYGVGGTNWKYATSNVTVTVPSGGMRTLALVRYNNSILFFGKY